MTIKWRQNGDKIVTKCNKMATKWQQNGKKMVKKDKKKPEKETIKW